MHGVKRAAEVGVGAGGRRTIGSRVWLHWFVDTTVVDLSPKIVLLVFDQPQKVAPPCTSRTKNLLMVDS